MAKHYTKYKNLVSFQTYNEPHYPPEQIYDYHPETIKAYRKYLVEKGIMNEEDAKTYMPPSHMPYTNEECEPWAQWRIFALERLSEFLAETADVAKKEDEMIASCTCLTSSPITDFNSLTAVDFYGDARDMDLVGATHYLGTNGADFFRADLDINFAESAAAYYGKHCWLVEYDARTDIPDRKMNEQTYMALGCGIKGIMYYQWRGDCPMPTSPEANGFGFLNYDGTEASNYANGMKMVDFLHRISDKLVDAEKLRSGLGILYSNHAVFMEDSATMLDAEIPADRRRRNATIQSTIWIYEQLKRNGFSADIVTGDAIEDNRLNVKYLFVPNYKLLSEKEKEQVEYFRQNGGKVFVKELYGFKDLSVKYTKYAFRDSIYDIVEEYKLVPFVEVMGYPFIMTNVIKGKDYYMISINNIKTKDQPIEGVHLKLHILGTEVVFMTTDKTVELKIENGMIELPPITDGGMLYVK